MKKGFLKISALLMAFLTLFSTLSFTIEKHICNGNISDVAVFDDLERCNMPEENHVKDLQGFEKESCCKDEIHYVQGSNAELKISQKLQAKVFAVLFTYTYLNFFENLEKDSTSFLSYSPPIVIKDIQVLYDTFLI
ncbi:HYC_CC_PP family protein [Aureibaculum conchae]|uniref:HYC_CC_PP family protein n=1 Tax=Aureibaculum sp. 2308TA14-22 TaxID=3108392 RepID=UPI003398F843